MKIDNINNLNFKEKILNNKNKKLVSNIRKHFEDIEQNGVIINNCTCKIPKENILLTTLDKAYNIGYSAWGDNLIIKKLPIESDSKVRYFKISPKNNLEYASNEFSDYEDVKKGSLLAKVINKYLSEILPKFL